MGLGVAEGSEAAGDCVFDLGHADIALGAGVGEPGVGLDGRLAGLEQDVHQDPPLMPVRGDVPKTATAGTAFGDRCGPRLHDQAVGLVPGGIGLRPRALGTGARVGDWCKSFIPSS